MTDFAIRFWDRLFGKRVEIEVPSSSGGTVRRRVTERWLKSMEAEGKFWPAGIEERASHLLRNVETIVALTADDLVQQQNTLRWVQGKVETWRACLSAASIGLAGM